MPFETTITYNIMKYLNDMDGVIMEKVKGEAECSGRADINGCYHGQSVRIEVKTPDNRNKPTKKQLYNLWQWHKAGAITIVAYSLEAVQAAFEEWDKSKSKPYHNIVYKEKNKCVSLIMYPNKQRSFQTFYQTYYNKDDLDNGV
jgi:hypothetical protein